MLRLYNDLWRRLQQFIEGLSGDATGNVSGVYEGSDDVGQLEEGQKRGEEEEEEEEEEELE